MRTAIAAAALLAVSAGAPRAQDVEAGKLRSGNSFLFEWHGTNTNIQSYYAKV